MDLLSSVGLEPGDDFRTELTEAGVRHGAAATEVATLEAEIGRANELEGRIVEAEVRRDVARRLSDDLKPSRFLAFLLEEERAELAELGSEHFEQLTDGAYRFADDGSFAVAGPERGGQVRKADSLSGGETFLASLALALALAEMVARGGGRLDSFFLDEGFGSLDPEHLDRAMDGIGRLVSENDRRLVVLVSHVAEMRDAIEDLIVLGQACRDRRHDRPVRRRTRCVDGPAGRSPRSRSRTTRDGVRPKTYPIPTISLPWPTTGCPRGRRYNLRAHPHKGNDGRPEEHLPNRPDAAARAGGALGRRRRRAPCSWVPAPSARRRRPQWIRPERSSRTPSPRHFPPETSALPPPTAKADLITAKITPVLLDPSPWDDVAIWSLDGQIVYSTDRSLIGQRPEEARTSVRDATESGTVSSEQSGGMFSVLIPLRFRSDGPINAAIQLARPDDVIVAAGRPWRYNAILMTVGLIITLLVLYRVMRLTATSAANASFSNFTRERGRAAPAGSAQRPLELPSPGLREEADARRKAEERATAAEERLNVIQDQYRKTLEELHVTQRMLQERPAASGPDPEMETRLLKAEGQARLVEGQLKAMSIERDKLARHIAEQAKAKGGQGRQGRPRDRPQGPPGRARSDRAPRGAGRRADRALA